ncbi:MAG: YIEGIA family protein [Bacillota bacterium]|nr:YIEGIA family protein [Bacillota bacterium]
MAEKERTGKMAAVNEAYLQAMFTGVFTGFFIRYLLLKRDHRQYPSYPHGVMSHLALAFIAAVIGSIAIPALMEKEFTAVTFLALAATQFREVRSMERTMLEGLDKTGLISRGPDYIEGIARVFEARNYLVMFTSLIVGGVTYWGNIFYGLLVGAVAFLISRRLMSGTVIGQIARVREGKVSFDGPNLFVDGIHFMNLGTDKVREEYMERALGVIIEPFDDNARATLANNGQRMAIAHDSAALLGVYKDVDTAEFTPIVRRDLDTGRVGMVIVPIEKDIELLIEAVKRVPVLESSLSTPLKTSIGRKASD